MKKALVPVLLYHLVIAALLLPFYLLPYLPFEWMWPWFVWVYFPIILICPFLFGPFLGCRVKKRAAVRWVKGLLLSLFVFALNLLTMCIPAFQTMLELGPVEAFRSSPFWMFTFPSAAVTAVLFYVVLLLTKTPAAAGQPPTQKGESAP